MTAVPTIFFMLSGPSSSGKPARMQAALSPAGTWRRGMLSALIAILV